jgi:hypothetical protein
VVNHVKSVTARVRKLAAGDDEGQAGHKEDGNMDKRQEALATESKQEASDPAALAIAREARQALELERQKVSQEVDAMKSLLQQIEETEQTTAQADFSRVESDPWLSEEMLFGGNEDVEYVSTKPFSYIPGLENVELSVPVVKKGGKDLPCQYRRLEHISADNEQSHYKGSLKGGRPHGQGTFSDPASGDKYEGEWLNGLFNGKGTLVKRNGIVYEVHAPNVHAHTYTDVCWYKAVDVDLDMDK